jgi:hypothetical protein
MALSCSGFFYWVTSYPDGGDPKNIDYVLWKHHLNRNMNLDDAVAGMTHDTWAVRLVRGMTKDQLKERFGYIREFRDARPYLQMCASTDAADEIGMHPQNENVVYLRDSDWMVVMRNGRAADLVLCKGY